MIETERLFLRSWQEADAEVLFKYVSDSDIGSNATWMPHISMEYSMEIIRTVFAVAESYSFRDYSYPGCNNQGTVKREFRNRRQVD